MGAAEDIAKAMPELESWIGRSRVVEEEIALAAVRRIAGTFDMDPDAFRKGDEIPRHWFNLFFSDVARQSAIGPDGHPRKGEFLPPIPLPRRMGAGRRVTLHGALRIGDLAEKRVEVAGIVPKSARTGQIVILTMRHTVTARGETLAVEEFDAIYREEVPKGAAGPKTSPPPAPEDHVWEEVRPLDPVQVFRYGAITWNAHRIHYDADYSRGEEGYPGVVMNGGLTMHLMADAAIRRAGRPPAGFVTRLVSPLFVGDHVAIRGAPAEGGMRVWAANKDGALAGEMTLEFPA
jgi:3-methylfumaryl-CoA hydratase